MANTTVRKPTEIQSPALYRVRDKATHEVFYLVQSDSQEHVFYQVRFDHSALVWRCNCGDPHTCCKHSRAVGEVLRLRRQRIAEEMGGDTPATVARMQAKEDERNFSACRGCGHLKHGVIADYVCDQCQARQAEADRRQHGVLNNRNEGFSLLKR